VDAALTDRRSLLITWLNRGTLHLVRAEDYWWLHPLVTPQLAVGNARRLKQEGVSERQADHGVLVIAEQVANNGPRTRSELRAALDAARVPTAGQALVHLLVAASLRGHVVRGPMRGGEQCFVGVEEWLGAGPEPLDRPEALTRLARRYLTGHAASDARDLSMWAGITLGDARSGLAGIADEVVERPDGLLELSGRPPAGELPGSMLLGPFDPLLHGWTSREYVLGSRRDIVTTNGIFRSIALVAGQAAATWGLSGGRLTLQPFGRLRKAHVSALEVEAQDVLRFLGLPPRPMVVGSD